MRVVCVCVAVCVRALASVRVCVHACVYACVCMCETHTHTHTHTHTRNYTRTHALTNMSNVGQLNQSVLGRHFSCKTGADDLWFWPQRCNQRHDKMKLARDGNM